MAKKRLRADWKEVGFGLSGPVAGALALLTLPEWSIPILLGLTGLPAIQLLRQKWSQDVTRMQRSAFGWHSDDLFGVYGSNEWQLQQDGRLFRPAPNLPPAPAFNYRGLLGVAASYPDIEIVPAEHNKPIELSGNTLLVGGTRVTPKLAEFLKLHSLPFDWISQNELRDYVQSNEPPARIVRHFGDNDKVYTRTSITGKYLVDTRDPERPPFGPFVDEAGRITGDVLVLTLGRDPSGHRVVVANAGYGAADRLADAIADGDNLEEICRQVPNVGPTHIQAVFTLPVEHTDKGEVYGKPELMDVESF